MTWASGQCQQCGKQLQRHKKDAEFCSPACARQFLEVMAARRLGVDLPRAEPRIDQTVQQPPPHPPAAPKNPRKRTESGPESTRPVTGIVSRTRVLGKVANPAASAPIAQSSEPAHAKRLFALAHPGWRTRQIEPKGEVPPFPIGDLALLTPVQLPSLETLPPIPGPEAPAVLQALSWSQLATDPGQLYLSASITAAFERTGKPLAIDIATNSVDEYLGRLDGLRGEPKLHGLGLTGCGLAQPGTLKWSASQPAMAAPAPVQPRAALRSQTYRSQPLLPGGNRTVSHPPVSGAPKLAGLQGFANLAPGIRNSGARIVHAGPPRSAPYVIGKPLVRAHSSAMADCDWKALTALHPVAHWKPVPLAPSPIRHDLVPWLVPLRPKPPSHRMECWGPVFESTLSPEPIPEKIRTAQFEALAALARSSSAEVQPPQPQLSLEQNQTTADQKPTQERTGSFAIQQQPDIREIPEVSPWHPLTRLRNALSAVRFWWQTSSTQVRLMAAALPLLIIIALKPVSNSAHSGAPTMDDRPTAPVRSSHVDTGRGVGTIIPTVPNDIQSEIEKHVESETKKQLSSFRQSIIDRAAVAIADDFQTGLDSWDSRGQIGPSWSYDRTGFIRPRALAVYRPSVALSDYNFEFLGKIDQRAMSWVFRASNLNNYYVMKLVDKTGGPIPQMALVHYAVIEGHEGPKKEVPLPMTVYKDTLFRIRMDIQGPHFSVMVQGQVVDYWKDERLKSGGVGFFSARGEESRIRWVQVTHQDDMLGKLCAFLSPYAM